MRFIPDLIVGPGMFYLDQSMFDLIFVADPIEDGIERIAVAGAIGQLDSIAHLEACSTVPNGARR
ncbi:hypothetical protein [Rhizobium leguminosarum]